MARRPAALPVRALNRSKWHAFIRRLPREVRTSLLAEATAVLQLRNCAACKPHKVLT